MCFSKDRDRNFRIGFFFWSFKGSESEFSGLGFSSGLSKGLDNFWIWISDWFFGIGFFSFFYFLAAISKKLGFGFSVGLDPVVLSFLIQSNVEERPWKIEHEPYLL